MRILIAAIAALSLTATPAFASPCREGGKFVKCPAAKPKPRLCKDAKGKFVKCGTKGSHYVK